MKLARFFYYAEHLDPIAPQSVKDWLNGGSDWPYDEEGSLKWLIEAYCCLCNKSKTVAMSMHVLEIETAYLTAKAVIDQVPTEQQHLDELSKPIEADGCFFSVVNPTMKSETVGAIMQGLELKRIDSELGKNNVFALPRLAAIFLRKEGESFEDIDIEERAAFWLVHGKLATITAIDFFLRSFQQKQSLVTGTSSVLSIAG